MDTIYVIFAALILIALTALAFKVGYNAGYSDGFWKAANMALKQGNIAILKIALRQLKEEDLT